MYEEFDDVFFLGRCIERRNRRRRRRRERRAIFRLFANVVLCDDLEFSLVVHTYRYLFIKVCETKKYLANLFRYLNIGRIEKKNTDEYRDKFIEIILMIEGVRCLVIHTLQEKDMEWVKIRQFQRKILH